MDGKNPQSDDSGCLYLVAIAFFIMFALNRCTPHVYPWNSGQASQTRRYVQEP